MASTDRREALRAAVLKVLPVDPHDGEAVLAITKNDEPSALGQPLGIDMCWGDPGVLADAIVDAVMAVAEEGVTVEWGVSCTEEGHKHHGPMPIWFMSRGGAERYIGTLGGHELIYRRRFRSEWEAVPHA